VDAAARLTAARLPIWTLVICTSAVLIFGSAAIQAFLIYDRNAIAHGELWRLVTGNFAHFSITHLGYDLVTFLIVGTIIEVRGYRYFSTLCFSAATLIGVVLYFAEPAMHYYAGLSGVATAAVTYLCLHGLTEKGTWRWLCVAMLVGLSAKIGIELALGNSLLFDIGMHEFVPVPLSHLVGAITALLLFVLVRLSELGRGAQDVSVP
jgi:rhomboid family GlyGly-CTERM serine protease